MNHLISCLGNVEMSPKEIEIFQSYHNHLNESYDLFKKTNLAISIQESQLRALKVQMEIEQEKFVVEREAAKKKYLKK